MLFLNPSVFSKASQERVGEKSMSLCLTLVSAELLLKTVVSELSSRLWCLPSKKSLANTHPWFVFRFAAWLIPKLVNQPGSMYPTHPRSGRSLGQSQAASFRR